MSQTLTVSAPLAMSAVPALMLTGGIIVGWFLRADLSTSIEAARLVARNDEQAARWLWKRGYRSTPHAGPDITPEPLAIEAGDTVLGEVLHVEHATGPLPVLADVPAGEDEVGDEQPGEAWFAGIVRALNRARRIALVAVVVPPLFVWSWCVHWPIGKAKSAAAAWRRRRDERYLIGSGEQATSVDPFAELLAHVEAVEPEPVSIVRVNHRYRRPSDTGLFPLVKVVGDKAAGRHRQAPEPEMPAVNAAIPAQRTGDEA
jgi:hypothetical protein